MSNRFQDHCLSKAFELLGVTRGPLTNNKKAKWWQPNVEEKVRNKKNRFKIWQKSGSDDDREIYRRVKKRGEKEGCSCYGDL
ncbi:unnamed protein product [Danaus chrysippus]|uniref:(African queen) hypothetical protein n=1 Tax=Danaus chrysippus TaxID=151541 RepID=A0A8J2QSW7_9NEOP|nr:unnamed protein product [Danaus chrysippus]